MLQITFDEFFKRKQFIVKGEGLETVYNFGNTQKGYLTIRQGKDEKKLAYTISSDEEGIIINTDSPIMGNSRQARLNLVLYTNEESIILVEA